jgi:uncharacterized membrane protein YqhA
MSETVEKENHIQTPIEKIFEQFLWNSRLIILVPVIMSLAATVGVVVITTVDTLSLFGKVFDYTNPMMEAAIRSHMRLEILAQIVTVIDGYLLAAIMLIFALGLYELFIGKIDIAENSSFAARLLHIASIDDLKNRLARVVLLILIVKFFQLAIGLSYTSPQDLLFLAVSIIMIGGALYLTNH